MHEVSLMQSTLELAADYARRQGATRIHRIRLRIGALSGVVPEAMEFAFEIVARETMADGAELQIEDVPIVCRCAKCGTDFRPSNAIYDCPLCGELSLDIRQGRELELASLEVS